MREDVRPCPKRKFVLWRLFCAGWGYASVGSLVLLLCFTYIDLNTDNFESTHAVITVTFVITKGLTWLLMDVMPRGLPAFIVVQVAALLQIVLVWGVGEFALSRKTTATYSYFVPLLSIGFFFLGTAFCLFWFLLREL